MSRFRTLAALVLLSACGKNRSDDTVDDLDARPDTSETPDSGITLAIDYTWDPGGLALSVTPLAGAGFDLGMAETGSEGAPWSGEDCLNGTDGYVYCHGFTGASAALTALGSRFAPARDPDNVVEGRYTLLNEDLAYYGDGTDRITYMVTFDDASCWVWGHQVAHFAARGCGIA